MTREEMLARVREIVNSLKIDINAAIELGMLGPEDAEEYTWCDMLYDYTNVDVNSYEELEQLSDDDLAQIINSYV